MALNVYGFWYALAATILILSSITTIILTGINLNNLLYGNTVKMMKFPYNGNIGDSQPFCMEPKFLIFGWLCGFLTIPALFTGFFACWVKRSLSKFALFFLVWSGITAFITSMITAIVTSLMLFCDVTITGGMTSGILFIAIFSVVQSIASMICFFKVCTNRSEEAMDLKYGIEPIPDPWTIAPSNAVYVEGRPPLKLVEDDGLPIFNFTPVQSVEGYGQKTVYTGSQEEPSSKEKRVILNSSGIRQTPLPPVPRQQLFPNQNIVKPFTIDRVGSSLNPYSHHELPYNCKPLG